VPTIGFLYRFGYPSAGRKGPQTDVLLHAGR